MFQLKKIGWVKKAIQRFRQNSAFRRPDQLKKVHYQLLGDRVIGSKSSVISPQNQVYKFLNTYLTLLIVSDAENTKRSNYLGQKRF